MRQSFARRFNLESWTWTFVPNATVPLVLIPVPIRVPVSNLFWASSALFIFL